ncbi:sorbosone dehydrogenase family protein [Pseudomonas sp. RIT-PI-AD]|uniref:PQQ-dependent sugar dehydrogenase n=1 Tax=Pseudomonas sp. RIT-PI-AD TaxID=3035294 RepID=UPI0021DAD43B|nr:sorbosone dehydrogenase family protein [Pseudomonas sp. RIT-PI-AD]
MTMLRPASLALLAAALAGCGENATLTVAAGTGPRPQLPAPNATLLPTVNIAPAVGWPAGTTPRAAEGLKVNAFASGLDHPRWLHVLPNGDVLVAESNAPEQHDGGFSLKKWASGLVMKRAGAGVPSPDRITLLRDADGDGVAEIRTVFLQGLHSPFGMALVEDQLYVADTDALLRFPYRSGDTRIEAAGSPLTDLPAGPINHHWTKNVIASRDGRLLYVTVGSNSNVAENGLDQEEGRAAIWEVDRASGHKRLFASGLRNPNGMAWEPRSGALWTVVNERDEIGSDLVPDYTTAVRDGDFFGWPFSYYGQHLDSRVEPQRPDLVAKARMPDYALGPHTASLGLAFASGTALPERFREGLFVGQHGSWNREPHSGYKVIFVPFANGQPNGEPLDVLTGFLDSKQQAMGRPVGVAEDGKGALLVSDDVGNAIWRVTAKD